MKKIFVCIIYCAGITYFISMILVSIYGHIDTKDRADIAIVLGSKVNKDGTLSDRLKSRMDRSIELYMNKQVKHLLLSGGTGKEGFDESSKMMEYAMAKGVKKDHIITDSNGYNTKQTAENSSKLLKENGLKNIIIVTQHFHIFRTKLAMELYGIEIIGTAHPNFYEMRDIYSLFREILAILKYTTINEIQR